MLLRLVRTYLRPYAAPLAAVVALQFVGTMAALALPSLNADIIDNGVVTGDTGYIVRHGGLMLAVSFVQVVCSIAAVWFSARNAMGFGRDLRAAIFRRVGSFSAREVQHFGAPSLITRETNDVQQVQMLVLMGGTLMVAAPIMMVGGIIMAAREDIGLSWLVLAVVPVLGISIGLIIRQMVPSFRLMQERIDEVNRLLREQITGVRVVRAFVREEHETTRFADANAQLTEVAIRAGRWQAAMFPTVMVVANVATVGVLWFGGHRVEAGHMEVGALTAYISYLMQIVMSVMMAMFMLMMAPRARPRRGHLRLPRRRRAGAARGHDDRPARGDAGDRRVDRRRQVDARQPRPAPLRRDRGSGARRRGRRTRHRPRDAVVPARPGAAEGLPLPRDHRRQPALRQARRDRGGDVGGARDLPGEGVRRGDARRARVRGGPGWDQPQRRAAPAHGDRAGGDPPPGDLPVRRLLLGARPHHRRPAAGGAEAGDAGVDGGDRGPTRRDHPSRRPDRGDGGRRRRRQ